MKKKIIVLIDAWSGGKYLIPAFQGIGYFCLHIQSHFVPQLFIKDNDLAVNRADRNIKYTGNIDEIIHILKQYDTKVILPGSEGAVTLADRLNKLMQIKFSNNINDKLILARRNKFNMQEQLAFCNLPSIKQKLISTIEDLSDWLQNKSYPVVLKPLQSAGSDRVFFCQTLEEAKESFFNILNAKNLFDENNDAVLCQEYIEGDEYVVNGVAAENKYIITDIWKSDKKIYEETPVYDVQYLIDHEQADFNVLSHFVKEVCQALGIINGAFHAEVKLTTNGPILLEVGARLAGGAVPYIIEECQGYSQITKLLQAILHHDAFHSECENNYHIKKKAAYVYLISPHTGKVTKKIDAYLEGIDGITEIKYQYKQGEIQKKTIDLLSSPGIVIVIRDNQKQLEESIHKIRCAESKYYKTIEPIEFF